MMESNMVEEPEDFSLVLGGPLFQLFRKSHLAGDNLDLPIAARESFGPTA
jgi:hypothetical protein